MKELGKFEIPSVDGDSSKKEQKGSINNPYTIDEYEQLHDQNLWEGGYVEGVGLVQEDVLRQVADFDGYYSSDDAELYPDADAKYLCYPYQFQTDDSGKCTACSIRNACILLGLDNISYHDITFDLNQYYSDVLHRYVWEGDSLRNVLTKYFTVGDVSLSDISTIVKHLTLTKPIYGQYKIGSVKIEKDGKEIEAPCYHDVLLVEVNGANTSSPYIIYFAPIEKHTFKISVKGMQEKFENLYMLDIK